MLHCIIHRDEVAHLGHFVLWYPDSRHRCHQHFGRHRPPRLLLPQANHLSPGFGGSARKSTLALHLTTKSTLVLIVSDPRKFYLPHLDRTKRHPLPRTPKRPLALYHRKHPRLPFVPSLVHPTAHSTDFNTPPTWIGWSPQHSRNSIRNDAQPLRTHDAILA